MQVLAVSGTFPRPVRGIRVTSGTLVVVVVAWDELTVLDFPVSGQGSTGLVQGLVRMTLERELHDHGIALSELGGADAQGVSCSVLRESSSSAPTIVGSKFVESIFTICR